MKNIINKSIGIFFALALFLGGAQASLAATPTVTVTSATAITTTTATLNASFNDNGSAISGVLFKYGTNPLMTGTAYATTPITSSGTFSANITGLLSGTQYYVQALVISDVGVTASTAPTTPNFTTTSVVVSAPTLATVTTIPGPTGITSSSATVSGLFNDNGTPISILTFDYGTDVALGTSSVASFSGSSGTATTTLSGLTPDTNYWYRITAINAAGTAFGSVYSFKTSSTITPPISCAVTISANPSTITAGNSTTLSWTTSTGCTSATSSFGSVSLVSGSITLSPTTTTTYTITGSGPAGSDTKQVTVFVNPIGPSACIINSFSSNINLVTSGSPVTLSWVSSNCNSASISPTLGSVAVSGSTVVYPISTTTYTLTTSGLIGSDSRNLAITVNSNNNPSGAPSTYSYPPSYITSSGATLIGYANGNGNNINTWIEFPCGSGIRYNYQTTSNAINLTYNAYGLNSNTSYCYQVVAQDMYGVLYRSTPTIFNTNSDTSFWSNVWPFNNTNTGTTGTTTKTVYRTAGANNPVVKNSTGFDSSALSAFPSTFSNSGSSFLGASAAGSGLSFLPSTLAGWLLLIIFVLTVVFVAREFTSKPKRTY